MKFEGHYFCRGFVNKATNLFYCFNKNHCLVNGNKRMACLTLSAFCDINGYAFLIPEDELYTLAKTVVNSDTADMVKTLRKIRHTLKIYLLKL
jgi:prophage maintenance system killer protein